MNVKPISTLCSRKLQCVVVVVLCLATILIWQAVFERISDDILKVTFLDVGQGDSIFIECPNGRQVLIDGGPDQTVLEQLSRLMPLHDRTIDLVILTHPDSDHITGLIGVLEYYEVSGVITSGFEADSAAYRRWQEMLETANIPVVTVRAGQEIVLQSIGEDIVFKIFWPETGYMADKANNASIVGQLIYGQSELLLTGDIEASIERRLVAGNWDLQSDILKAAHHGSKSSSIEDFLDVVDPYAVVISVGVDNRYGHPHPAVLKRLQDVRVYRTDRDGAVTVTTNGKQFKID